MYEKLPMSRLQAWTLESRTRYALVWGGINAAVVSSLGLWLSDFSVGRALFVAALALLVGGLAQWLIWYPRAKRKLTTPPAGS